MSYNRPKFSPCATWNPNAVTFANSNTVVLTPSGIFVNTNNTVHAVSLGLSSVLVWPEGSVNPTKNVSSSLSVPYGVFVTVDGDVYADNGLNNHSVEKWTVGASTPTIALYVTTRCGGLFVDIYGNLYCSVSYAHRVVQGRTSANANTSVIVAGTGTNGSASNMLSTPYGIFVDIDLSLYVADYDNNRIQLFQSGNLSGTTVAGSGAPATIALACPTGIVLDADGYLFISDRTNSRIVGSGPNGFRCVAACTGTNGAAANQLYSPYALSFDSYGNLYVTDAANNRIQKFTLARNSCGESSAMVFF